MSRSSGSETSEGRAQVEPLAALVAAFAVGVALSAYAGVLSATVPSPDRNLAEPTVEKAERAISEAGVAEPAALLDGLHAGPDGYHVNLTLDAAGQTWHAGPTPPSSADTADVTDATAADTTDTATATVSVRLAPGRIRPGRLQAEVWA
jgi:hypothetical protein